MFPMRRQPVAPFQIPVAQCEGTLEVKYDDAFAFPQLDMETHVKGLDLAAVTDQFTNL